ncbi:DNA glycosylase [Streptomyces abyssalis]|uniref:DNA-(apurinic or apyrimidinic site) lyase n=1 Tax=Streptomyces abyssalis TaxID=933944 RepID=A0A1E7JHN4_9ACTN|nr:DNA-formamidopyrimidine glycosylase family protein [Streptomyces abyssalis]OEU85973.1 DNA glycosylase [Streptomyces abyssalis]OEU92558.1 DNA glycosylase [Streptomyces abyssalis]OEV28914.1 DNA glycosylase [Streptomyces nanshensis]
MPEGDTVWYTARRLHGMLAGQALTRTDFRVPRLATADLSGRRALEAVPRGKHILIRVESGVTIHSHLGMEGAWRVSTPERPARGGGGPSHQIRVVLATATGTATGYRLPLLELLRTDEESAALGHLGPDLLGPDWDAHEARQRLLAEPDRPLVEALLDQRNLAGIGNVYAAELCFLAGRSPWSPVGELPPPRLEKLLAAARNLLDANKERLDRRTTQAPAGSDRDRALWVYGRTHRPCHRCGNRVRTGTHGPPDRSRTAFYCPRCQPGPQPKQP